MPKNMKGQKPEILQYLQTHTWKETATEYNVSEQTLARWKKEKPPKVITPTKPRKVYIPKPKVGATKIEVLEYIVDKYLTSPIHDYAEVAKNLNGEGRNNSYPSKKIKDFLDMVLQKYRLEMI